MSATIESFCLETIKKVMNWNDKGDCVKLRTVNGLLKIWEQIDQTQAEHDGELSRRNAQLALDLDNALAAKHLLLEAVEKAMEISDTPGVDSILRAARDAAVASSGNIGGHEEGDLG